MSVIIPVFNVEDYLAECLDSVINQTFQDMEIICIDDVSTDNSFNILKEYALKDPRIIVLQNEQNSGQSFARNVGLDKASGDYIAFVDSDDYVEINMIASAVDKIEHVDIVCFDYKKTDELWGSDDEHLFLVNEGEYKAQDFFAATMDNNSIIYSPWSKLYKRDFLIKKNIRFVNGIKYEDVVFHFLCMLKADTVYCIPDKLYTYRVRNNSTMTQKINSRNITDYFYIMCYLSQYYLSNSFDTALQKAIEKYIQVIYHSFISNYRRYALTNDAYLLKKDFAEENYAKLYGLVSGYENYNGAIQDCIAEHIEFIKSAKTVIVYGAGDIAREVLETLNRYDIAIDGIAVSNQSNSRKSVLGNRVHAITEYMDQKEDSLIIMATSSKFYPEIKKYLLELGFVHCLELF